VQFVRKGRSRRRTPRRAPREEQDGEPFHPL
jgi:hypothetical protein